MSTKQTDEKLALELPPGDAKDEAILSQGLDRDEMTEDEPKAHIHFRTYAAVFAVGLIYLVQNFAIVGAGSVRNPPSVFSFSAYKFTIH